MLRFLLTRRWLGLLLVVVVLGLACVWLSRWQFGRYRERAQDNDVIRSNLSAPAVPAARLMSVGSEPAASSQYRSVTAVGRYDVSHQIVVRYRTRDGAPGAEVVTPLVTGSGAAVLVDRGWVPATGSGSQNPPVPPPPAGRVTVTGWLRLDSTDGSDVVTPVDSSVRAVSAKALKPTLPYPAYEGFVDLTRQVPSTTPAPKTVSAPDLGGGPSFFYGWQWLFFALLFFGFWCYFAWAEYQEQVKGRRRSAGGPSTTASAQMRADTHDRADARG